MTPPTVIFLLLATMLPAAAQAHAILVESTPALHATMAPGYVSVSLRFNSRIDRDRSRLTLVAPGEQQTRLAITAAATPDTMAATAELAPGDYTVHWQVLAVDGHITRGDVPFTVAAPPMAAR